jgi:adenosylcobinamide-phosphate synthase
MVTPPRLGRGVRPMAVAAGIMTDRLLGEPPASVHPVAAFGRVMEAAEARWYSDRRSRGLLYAGGGVGAAALLGWMVERASPRTRAAAVVATTYLTVAGRALSRAAAEVGDALTADDLARARRLLPSLVGRDPSALDAAGVARAVVESVAENTVDAVVAPAVWALAGGAPAVLAYRAVNTLDAMVGHRSSRYQRFGWAAARADDVMGWVPARLTAFLVILVRPRRAAAVRAAVRRQAPLHPSPNAGVAEAAFAAALGLRLGGINDYGGRLEHRPPLGTGRPPTGPDIQRACTLSRDVTLALTALTLAASGVGR